MEDPNSLTDDTPSRDDLVLDESTSHDESDESSPSQPRSQRSNSRDARRSKHYKTIMRSYKDLSSRRVDLVGDYAGNELFIIEGDSLLLHCFDDPQIDFNEGFQMLHAVYNVEKFLHNLTQRKCNFNIVFFENNKRLCVPAGVEPKGVNKYLLTRAVIIRHLKVNLLSGQNDIAVETFKCWECAEFLQYLQDTPPYFVMMHDASQTQVKNTSGKAHGISRSMINHQTSRLRSMILQSVRYGFNVALVNEVECRDTKVMTVVLEAGRQITTKNVVSTVLEENQEQAFQDNTELLQKIRTVAPRLSERQLLAVISVSHMVSDMPEDVPETTWTGLCSMFLMHQAHLATVPLTDRGSTVDCDNEHLQIFVDIIAIAAREILEHSSWEESLDTSTAPCDLADFVDGRMLTALAMQSVKPPSEADKIYATLQEAVAALNKSTTLPEPSKIPGMPQSANEKVLPPAICSTLPFTTVLPFSDPTFDKHLQFLRIDVDSKNAELSTTRSRKVFKEISHWHNAKRPLVRKGPQQVADPKQVFWANKRNQQFMAEMQRYAASLTNAVGRSLEPETIVVGSSIKSLKAPLEPPSSNNKKAKTTGKKAGGGKTAAKNSEKQARNDRIAADHASKLETTNTKVVLAWHAMCKSFEASSDPVLRYRKAQQHLLSLNAAARGIVAPECELYMVNCLLSPWIEACRAQKQVQMLHIPALIWAHLSNIQQHNDLPNSIAKSAQSVADEIELQLSGAFQDSGRDRKLAFTLILPVRGLSLSIQMPWADFQLLHCGPYLERSFDSKPDQRVDFVPDGWQRTVLDGIDKDESVFVIAPTSAGKTFISFYAMRKVLEADDDGVLVYVAPTKALVNQIAAEIQARYSKSFRYGGKSVWAIHTRDYRINNPSGCQVLVTVPHILQIMLMAPSNANTWSNKLKCIIFDEVHSIGQAEDGVVWEQLLLMASCPIIALSATVGNPSAFGDWLASTQRAVGHELKTIQHPHRYSDLRKFYYVPPTSFSFTGLAEAAPISDIGLDNLTGFNHIHPVAALVDKSRGIPEDLALEPRDCLSLWQAMIKVQTKDHSIPESLHPQKALPTALRKSDVLAWEKELKVLLQRWLDDQSSPFTQLVEELEQHFRKEEREDMYTTQPSDTGTIREIKDSNDFLSTTLPLLSRLHEQNALPAILFNYDRHLCEEICKVLLTQLEHAESEMKKSGLRWQRTLDKWEEWKDAKEKLAAKIGKFAKKSKKAKDDDHEKLSKLDIQKDNASTSDDKWESFDPKAPIEGFHFADHTKVQASELEIYVRQLRFRQIPDYLVQALERGIGVHHAGMNRKYRQIVEILFRKRFLRVVIATGTLALGINMPCKTVAFSGDSVYLTALNYRQCAGRAGRRGFDLLGNVVFHGISRQKVCRLISSRLPELTGHFPITTSLVLRMFTLLHESKRSKYAVGAIDGILSQPRMYMGGPSFKDQIMHHLRFSIEYLRRQHLLSEDGAPLNFAGLVGHLYYTENSPFAFHALLKEGYFNELCVGIRENEQRTLETLMLVMCHLFNHIDCRRADTEFREKVMKPSSSMVFLPALPEQAAVILQDHNTQTLQVYKTYVKTFVDQHIKHADNVLPLTSVQCGADATVSKDTPSTPNATTSIRSSFVALSGLDDTFTSIHDLCNTVRSGVFLEEAVIPYMRVSSFDSSAPLNAYLLDFYKHGDVSTIERENGIRRSDIWFRLNDFSMVLATIVTSLMNFLKLSDGTDMDMLDVQGGLDAYESAAEEDEVNMPEAPAGPGRASVGGSEKVSQTNLPVRKKATVLDSWDDAEDEVDMSTTSGEEGRDGAGSEAADALDGWDVGDGDGLMNVLKAFQKLQKGFNEKFRAMWA